jgi:3-oxoacyl-[acyl-carrier-protein] synthase-3
MEKLVDTSDEWITKRTGISTRHIAGEETAMGLSIQAAKDAITHAGISSSDIGLIITSTITNEYVTPSLASIVQKDLDVDCPCMDISAGCSGFVYALVTAASLMDSLNVDTALVISTELLSRYVDWTDRSTCVLFGDGSGAVVLQRSEDACMHFPLLSGTPDKEDVITIKKEERSTPFYDPTDTDRHYLRMKGSEVFTYAVGVVEETLGKLLEMCGDKPFTKIIPHQANEKIIDYIIRKLHFTADQFYINIGEYANTSSASIPIAMHEAYKKGWLKKGERLALVGFGSGLTCGGVVIDWTL